MRKRYLLPISFLLLLNSANAATIIVDVTSNQFTPANIPNAVVGDVIRFHFVQGFHNATSQDVPNGVPANAAPVNSGNASGVNPRDYDYAITQPGVYKYVCIVHANAAAYTGMVGTFTASSALPVSLKTFNLIPSVDKKPLLNWVTASEENVSHFSIRYSYDGFKYTEAAKVTAAGNSSTEKTYTYKHAGVSPKFRYVYYMMAMVDKDGTEKFSKVAVFKNTAGALVLITQIGPNPIKRPGQLMLQFNAETAGSLMARVVDANGKVALKLNMSANPGLNNGHLHVCDLPAGVYNIEFVLDGLRESKRIVIQ